MLNLEYIHIAELLLSTAMRKYAHSEYSIERIL